MKNMKRFNINYFKDVCEAGEAALTILDKQKDDPQKYQNEFLLKLIDDNKNTEYGIKYDFKNIKSIDDFKKKVPITEYADYEEYIERIIERKENNLITAYPIAHFAMSSGSTGNSKTIPVSHNSCIFSSSYVGNSVFAFTNRELIKHNKKPGPICALYDISLKYLEDNVTIGAASATTPYNFMDKIDNLYTSPLPLQCPKKTINEPVFLKALFALKERDMTCIFSTFSTIIVEFIKTIENNWPKLVEIIRTGELPDDLLLDEELKVSLQAYLEPDSVRADELTIEFNKGFNETILNRIWPNLVLIFSIGCGFMSEYARVIKHYGNNIAFHNSLYASSESILGIATGANETDYAMFTQGVFYEFLPIGEDDYSKTRLMSELEEGKDYEVIITNLSGFYRYRILDVIHIENHYGNIPTCNVLYRLNQMISAVGEKMSTYHFDQAIKILSNKIKHQINEYSIYVDYNVTPTNYKVFIEFEDDCGKGKNKEISDIFDTILQKVNFGYELCRNENFIDKADVILVEPGTYDVYKKIQILNGISPNQIKPVRIIDNPQKVRYFFGLSEGPYAALKRLTVDLERQNDELRQLKIENLQLKRQIKELTNSNNN